MEELATAAITASLAIHREIGPGLLESVYGAALAHRLRLLGLRCDREVAVPLDLDGERIPIAFRADLLVEGALLIEVKAVETNVPIHRRQVLTYLRLMNLPLGLLINFGMPVLKQGLRRIVNQHRDTAGSELRIHRP